MLLPKISGLSAGAGKLLREPSASAIRFCRAAAGLKNMCENFDHGTDPKSTAVAIRYNANIKFAPDVPAVSYTHLTLPTKRIV